jgi:DnaJ-class molecular chaperone
MSFYEAVFGIEKKVVIKRTEKCISCYGSGNDGDMCECNNCKGTCLEENYR